MKNKTIEASGTIDLSGNLRMSMGELKQFFKQHKGEKVIARFEAYPKGDSKLLKAYYYNYIVPKFKKAFWNNGERVTDEDVELKLREMSPVMHFEKVILDTGKYFCKLKNISEISNSEFIEHIETLKQIGAEEFSIYIDEPKTL